MKVGQTTKLIKNLDSKTPGLLRVRTDGNAVSVVESIPGRRNHPVYESKRFTVSKKHALELALLLIKAAQQ